ncbi:MAG TPA: N-acetylmuramoyl-L-alanine amidase, partial [Pirellulaceae bacterium]|nr:N-acetylmuramoyl-L-alanine amidase [Pirellulaceae bacterium]
LVDDTLVARTSLTTLDNVVCKPGRIYEIPAGSTVNITGDALVPAGSRLVIGNGARLNWQGRGVLEIEGVVTAGSLAKDAAPVVFDFGADPAQEGGLLIHGSLVAGSTFENCQFLHGHGTRLTRANPRTADDIDWNRVAKTVTRSPDARHPVGGAVCLVSAPLVSFRNCEFKRNAANQGGALYCINAKRLVVERCKFLENISGFSGGAIFAHGSELYASDCRFANTRTGIVWSGLAPDGAPTVGNEFASGGAVYGGLDTHLEMRGCRVIGNEANYVGGGIYLLDSNSSPRAVTRESIIADSRIVGNHSLAELGGAGIYVDQTSHVALSDVQFVINTSGSASTVAGQDLLDESRYRADAPDLSGVKFADNVLFFDPKLRNRKDAIPSLISGVLNVLQPASAGKEVFSTVAQPVDFGELRFARQRTTRAQVLGEPAVVAAKVLPSNCFEVQTTERSVDVIVVHHTSAIKWESLRKEFPDQVREFETRQGQMPPEARKYDWRHCLRIFELYGVSAHYLIDRNGVIRQLVDENDVAYHAGVSKMPPPDGRERVNDFSIGIELIASHPEDDPAVSRSTAYTPRQYQSLHWLLRDICLRRPAISVENILGHEDIAPGRKKDPGPHFDWPRVRQDLSDDLDAFSRMSMAH